MTRFVLYGSPHSLPTYKVALMLRLSGAPFSFRYVSFQKGMHRTPEFSALSRWGQVPVLLDDGRIYLQSAAIVEHLAETLGRFQGPDPAARQKVREWMYWDVDALFPPVFNCYGVQLGQRGLLPIDVEPAIATYHRQRAETALSVLDSHLAHRDYLCATGPTIADRSATVTSPSPKSARSM
ncbi:glutathione S-transferase family protein [Bradyrhizobium sp.]